jgi:hypothetical protein
VDLRVGLLLVRRLRSWSGNVGKRLVRAAKVFVRDSGLVHALLDLETWHDLPGHPVAGASWEGRAIETALMAAGTGYAPFFYRTEDGVEVDLVLERGGKVAMAIVIRRSTAPELSRRFRLGCDVLKPARRFLVHGGGGRWPIKKKVEAISLQELAGELASS